MNAIRILPDPAALTLLVLSIQGAKNVAPAALGQPYDPELR